MIPTPHIELTDLNKIAKTVIMPGDPLRAKFIVDNYLDDVVQINSVRNMLAYTGKYKGSLVTVMGSGMGMASIGIYSYELFKFYDVDKIIRVGSCGAYIDDLELYDILLVNSSFCESDFIKITTGEDTRIVSSSLELNNSLLASAKKQNIKILPSTVHSSDVFYRKNFDDYKDMHKNHGCIAVEMESAALFANAKLTSKSASCLLTVSDSLVTSSSVSSEKRQNSFTKMIDVALESII